MPHVAAKPFLKPDLTDKQPAITLEPKIIARYNTSPHTSPVVAGKTAVRVNTEDKP